MKTLLVIPPRIKSRHRDFALSYSNPHIGMACLAAALRQKGHEVRVVDAQVEELSFAEVERRAADFGPGLVGITAYTEQIEEAGRTAQEIKSRNPAVPIVIGGCHASALPRETLEEFPTFDFLVQGEGEETLAGLVQACQDGQPLAGIRGIAYRENGDVRVNPLRPFLIDLDSLTFPAFDLFPLDIYRSFHRLSSKSINLPSSTQRGCPYSCLFCYRQLGSAVRAQSAGKVIEQLRYSIGRFQPGQIVFFDENFTFDRERTFAILAGIQKEGLSVRTQFLCETRVDLVDRELLQNLRRSGFSLISYGIESGNQETLNQIGKNIKLDRARAAIRETREAGIKTQANFIIGYPYETRSQVSATIRFALDVDPDFCIFTIMTPFPGTRVREMAERGEGGARLLSRKWSHYGKHMGMSYETSALPRTYLERLQTWAYIKFYLRPGKIRNLFQHLRFRFLPYYLLHQLEVNLRPGRRPG
ncbi:MAG: radical SAM protein [bacterium]|nr:radical SAM protein [bacterium]